MYLLATLLLVVGWHVQVARVRHIFVCIGFLRARKRNFANHETLERFVRGKFLRAFSSTKYSRPVSVAWLDVEHNELTNTLAYFP